MMPDAQTQTADVSPPQALSGLIRPARVTNARGLDSCDLEILAAIDGAVLARGRLYQSESMAWQDPRLLRDIPAYAPGRLLSRVFINHQRAEDGEILWFVHERWGIDNPWQDLCLSEGDCVTGEIVRVVQRTGRPQPAGYIVQLDVGRDLGELTRNGIDWSEAKQPDIEVFLPIAELPWSDGSLDNDPRERTATRLNLDVGDRIRALVLEIQRPPGHPRISISRLIHHLDATAQHAFEHADTLTRWRFLTWLRGVKAADAPPDPGVLDDRDGQPYAGRRLLLVDDDADASASQAEILGLMGAEVQQVVVRPGAFPEAVADVEAALRGQAFDLALIDNNLPGRGLGQVLVQRVVGNIGDANPTRMVLLTADAALGGDPYDPATLRAKGLVGMVHRPLTHQALQRLLAGDEVWEEELPEASSLCGRKTAFSTAPAKVATPTPRALLEEIEDQSPVRFAVLVRARRRIDRRDLIAIGAAPFTLETHTAAIARSDLGLLVDGRVQLLDIGAKDGGNELLRLGRDGVAHWRVLPLGATAWIFGVGIAAGHDVRGRLGIWTSALTAALEVEQWRQWARHVSSFVQLGIAHQGLSHEVFNLESELGDLLRTLRRRVAGLEPGEILVEADKHRIEDAARRLDQAQQGLLEFSKRQLREQALRLREVYLPEAIETIRRIVASECREAEVALHLGTAPKLALPAPNAALVLPLVNLLINAAKHHYRADNRRVELLFDLGRNSGGVALVVDVRDNGPGLDQHALEGLWEPGFSTAPEATRRHGIGLWLARRLVEDAGGTLTLQENWRGLGTCFQLWLPMHLG
jgi:signal transduction histidine kinase